MPYSLSLLSAAMSLADQVITRCRITCRTGIAGLSVRPRHGFLRIQPAMVRGQVTTRQEKMQYRKCNQSVSVCHWRNQDSRALYANPRTDRDTLQVYFWEHSVILQAHRWFPYDKQGSAILPGGERSYPWDTLRLSQPNQMAARIAAVGGGWRCRPIMSL